jgi:hypothetical protein
MLNVQIARSRRERRAIPAVNARAHSIALGAPSCARCGTGYPRVMLGRKSDYTVATILTGRPTQRRFDGIYAGVGFNPR